MGRIFFDTDALDRINSELDNISADLTGIMNKVKNFDVPSVWFDWFSQKKFLDDSYCDDNSVSSNLYREIRKGKANCDEMENSINDYKASLNSFSNELVKNFNRIEDIDLKPRASIVISK